MGIGKCTERSVCLTNFGQRRSPSGHEHFAVGERRYRGIPAGLGHRRTLGPGLRGRIERRAPSDAVEGGVEIAASGEQHAARQLGQPATKDVETEELIDALRCLADRIEEHGAGKTMLGRRLRAQVVYRVVGENPTIGHEAGVDAEHRPVVGALP